ncbi:MAG: hypothetical protein ABIP20_20700 [Chthoniobacteraceae bacterium]
MKSKPFHRLRTALFSAAACAPLLLPAHAGETKKTVPAAPPDETHVHFLFDVQISSAYNTPRGMMVRDKGVTIQPLFLMFVDLYKGEGFINNVKLVGGCWNDLGTTGISKTGAGGFYANPQTNWTEIDPIVGLSIGLGKYFTLDSTYIGFAEQILNIGMVHNLETKLSFNDSEFLGAFALHPYFLYWQELENKTTNAAVPQRILGPSARSGKHPQPGSSHYFEIGIAPSYTFKNAGNLKVEAPTRVTFPDSRFYGEYYGSSSVVGLVETGLKATLPLPNFPKGYGHWSTYAGFKYQYYVDDNLKNLQAFNAPGQRTKDSWTFYGGVSVFF